MSRSFGARRVRRFRFGAGSLRRDVSDEFAFHVEMTVRELVESGLEPEAARREALRRLGDAELHLRHCREIGERSRRLEKRGEIVTDLLLDLKFALRTFATNPAFVAVAVLTLAIGIAANAVIFGMVNALIFSELPYGDAEELAIIWTTYPERGVTTNASSVPDWAYLRERSQAFEDIVVHGQWEANLIGYDEPLALNGYEVSANLLDVLQVEPAYGRGFVPGDDVPGADPVVLISWRLFQRLGADRGLVGSTLLVNELEHTVVGVMPDRFEYPVLQFRGDLWTPTRFTVSDLTETRFHRWTLMIGRLAPGQDISTANTELIRLTEQIEESYPESNTGVRARAIGLYDQLSEPMRAPLAVLLVTVGFVLLLCCANVANLFMARTTSRQSEVAIRTALGASRVRIVRQLLTESVMIALLGGAIGYGLSEIAGRALVASLPAFIVETIPGVMEGGADGRVILATFVLAGASALIFGLGPALRASRPQLAQVIRSGSARATSGAARGRFHSLLIIGQVAMSVVLVSGAGLLVKGFIGLLNTDPGFDPGNVLTMELTLTGSRYDEPEARRDFYRDLRERLLRLPGVEEAGATSILPLNFSNNTTSFTIEGEPKPETGRRPSAGYRLVTPGYLETLRVQLHAGRLLEPTDRSGGRAVVVVNDAFVRRYLDSGEPLGKRIGLSADDDAVEIVGVIEDVRHDSLMEPAAPAMFSSIEQADPWRRMYVTVRGERDPMALTTSIRDAVWAADPTLPIDDVRPMEEIVSTSLIVVELTANLMAVFAVCALVLAAVGLYGVMAYVVAQRAREVGIRMALGAEMSDVARMVLRRAALLAGAGILFGVALSWPVGQLLASVLEGVDGNELTIYLGVPALLLAITLLATAVPLRRALLVDPVESLRVE